MKHPLPADSDTTSAGAAGVPPVPPAGSPVRRLMGRAHRLLRKRRAAQALWMLELGCADDGRVAVLAARLGFHVVAAGSDASVLRRAARTVDASGLGARIFLARSEPHRLKYPPETFDLIVDDGCFARLRMQDGWRYRRGLLRILRHGGCVVLSIPGRRMRHAPRVKALRPWTLRRDAPGHLYTRTEWTWIFEKAFDVIDRIEERRGLRHLEHVLLRRKAEAGGRA